MFRGRDRDAAYSPLSTAPQSRRKQLLSDGNESSDGFECGRRDEGGVGSEAGGGVDAGAGGGRDGSGGLGWVGDRGMDLG